MDLQFQTPFKELVAIGPPDSLDHPLFSSTRSPRDDLVLNSLLVSSLTEMTEISVIS